MASLRRGDTSYLGDSWVVDQGNGSDASLEEEAPEAISSARQTDRLRKSAERIVAAPFHTSAPRRPTSKASSAQPGPELVMPSINESSAAASWIKTKGLKDELSTPRRRSSKASTPSSGPQARWDPKAERASSPTSGRSRTVGTQPSSSDEVVDFLLSIVTWLLDIFTGTLKTLTRPISWVLAIYLFAGLVTLVQNLLTSSLYTALSPICRIPGSSMLNLPMCHVSSITHRPDATPAPVEFEELMTVQSQFEEVLEQSAAGISLPLDMKRGETSIRDLRQIVRFSHLQSKNELVLEFDGFIETARIASYDLQRFNSHVGRGVDNVLATARWTQRVLDELAIKKSSRGLIPSFIQQNILAPFQPLHLTESRLLDQYIKHTRIVSEEIDKLIVEAQALLLVLSNLEDRLDVIHGIALRDNLHAQGSKDEILSQLWTMLGGNRAALGKYNSQLQLLRQVGEYRKIAWAHVSGTILKLQAMGTELEELRERVGSAEVLHGRAEVPLAVHVESIRLGVERLEKGREVAREVERGHLRRVLERGQAAELRLVDG